MRQTKKAELSGTTAETCEDNAEHLDADGPGVVQSGGRKSNDEHSACGEGDKDKDAHTIRDEVYKVRGAQLRQERRDDICKQHDSLRDGGSHQVKGCGKDNDIQKVIQKAYYSQPGVGQDGSMQKGGCTMLFPLDIPNNQKAV
jgi:hypothetical protein